MCEAKYNRCLTPDDRAFSFVSKDEIDVEDALTRALLRNAARRGGVELSDGARRHWLYAMVHWCGKLVCQTVDHEDGKLFAWDIRDGGTADDEPRQKSPKTASPEACLMHTDAHDFYGCIRDCEHKFLSGSEQLGNCETRCEHYCRR